MTDEDLPKEIRDAIGPHPVTELAQIIHNCTDLGTLSSEPTGSDENAAWGVYRWYQARMLDHEHLVASAQDWFDQNSYTLLPDWEALRRILLGNPLEAHNG